jgi:hypothetical protein
MFISGEKTECDPEIDRSRCDEYGNRMHTSVKKCPKCSADDMHVDCLACKLEISKEEVLAMPWTNEAVGNAGNFSFESDAADADNNSGRAGNGLTFQLPALIIFGGCILLIISGFAYYAMRQRKDTPAQEKREEKKTQATVELQAAASVNMTSPLHMKGGLSQLHMPSLSVPYASTSLSSRTSSVRWDISKSPEWLSVGTNLPQQLPEGWDARVDNSTRQIYYYNTTTGQTSWTPPHDTQDNGQAFYNPVRTTN